MSVVDNPSGSVVDARAPPPGAPGKPENITGLARPRRTPSFSSRSPSEGTSDKRKKNAPPVGIKFVETFAAKRGRGRAFDADEGAPGRDKGGIGRGEVRRRY